ncbi:MAG: hypothetical protein AAGC81_08040 [Pseudomonadota bacterium]
MSEKEKKTTELSETELDDAQGGAPETIALDFRRIEPEFTTAKAARGKGSVETTWKVEKGEK